MVSYLSCNAFAGVRVWENHSYFLLNIKLLVAVWEWTIILLIRSWSYMLSLITFNLRFLIQAFVWEEGVRVALARITFRHSPSFLFICFWPFVWVCAAVAWQGINTVLAFIYLFVVAASHVAQSLWETVKNLLLAADDTATVVWFHFNVFVWKSKPIWVF